MAKKNNEKSVVTVLEDVTFILNEIREEKLNNLEKTKLTLQQQKIVENIEKDLKVCVTKLGLVLHTTEL